MNSDYATHFFIIEAPFVSKFRFFRIGIEIGKSEDIEFD
jgi:hypothetical protein